MEFNYGDVLNLEVRQISWFLGRKSNLSLENKTLIYKCILKPIWTYGIQLWGCAQPKSKTNVMALTTKIQNFSRKQDLVYKCILKPIWTYVIQLWVCAKPSNIKIIQRLQSNVLRTIVNAPWYVSNFTLHKDLQIPFITEEIKRYSTIYHNRLIGHENGYVTELGIPLNVRRRLKRQWSSGWVIALQTADPSSRQRGRPMETRQ
jgi:hypothetical protein